MSLHEYLQTRQAALEAAYAKLREKTSNPYLAKVTDLCGLLVMREQLKNIADALGERNPEGAWALRRCDALAAERKEP